MTLSVSDREFVAVGASIGAGCHPCTQYHAQAALKAGLGAEQVLGAIQEAQAVRAAGGVAVANVGRRVLGVEQQEPPAQGPPPCRGSALARLGAVAGCNSGVLLAECARQAAGVSLDGGELREVVDIAEMVKTQAGKFLRRDAERAFGQIGEPAEAAAPPATSPSEPEHVRAAVEAGAAAADRGPGCGCEGG